MNKIGIQKLAKNSLSDLLDQSGSILYSSHETLRPGDVYLLGFNPGGSGGCRIENSIDSMLTNTTNAYLDESCNNGNGCWEKGEAPLQRRVQWIIKK